MRLVISILLALHEYDRNFALHYSERLGSIRVVRMDTKSILMIRVEVNSKSELVEDREGKSALNIVVTRPLQRDGGMAKTMEPQKPGNSTGPGQEVVERQRVAIERVVQRVRSWTAQNEMRRVLGRVSAGAVDRILDSANYKLIRAEQKAVFVAAKTRGNTASVTRGHKFLGENQGNLCVKEFR